MPSWKHVHSNGSGYASTWDTRSMPGNNRWTTPEWRKLRRYVLARDGHLCRIKGPHCTYRADQAHHVLGADVSMLDPQFVIAACGRCNRELGKPRVGDPEPRSRTRW